MTYICFLLFSPPLLHLFFLSRDTFFSGLDNDDGAEEILNNCFRYFPLYIRPNESPRVSGPQSGLQGRYKGSNLPALNEPRLRTRILGAKLAYIGDEVGCPRAGEKEREEGMSLQREETDR